MDDYEYEHYFKYVFGKESTFESENALERLKTLSNYIGAKNKIDLALGGWQSCTNRINSIVFCDECQIFAKNIEESDDCLELHKILSEHCYFVRDVVVTCDDEEKEEKILRCSVN